VSTGFRRRRKAGIVARFHPIEVQVLAEYVGGLLTLLDSDTSGRQQTSTVEGGLGDLADEENLDPKTAADLAVLSELESIVNGDHVDNPILPPDDPGLQRLLPSAYPDDDDAALDFRRFTQGRLLDRKRANARALLASLSNALAEAPSVASEADELDEDEPEVRVRLTEGQAHEWLAALNDLRLVLGVRLGVEQDDEDRWAALDDDDPVGGVHRVYSWLGWLQESLVAAVAG
jgi:hypothetical protein